MPWTRLDPAMATRAQSRIVTAVGGSAAAALLAGLVVGGLAVSSGTVDAQTATAAVADASPAVAASYVDDSLCAGCHSGEQKAWSVSHHAHAMEEPDEASVRGDFDDVVFESGGARYRFFRRDGAYVVETDGPDDRTGEFEVAYTFGWTPLQQYLVELDGGRLQALTVAWDTEAGRWFDLAEEPARPGDPLHWRGREYNWNFRCADCHSTNLIRNYDLESDSFDTTWSNVTVGCQACHGPGSAHVAWAQDGSAEQTGALIAKGLVVPPGGEAQAEINACARCHSRRRQITGHSVVGEPFLDHYVPELLDEGLYFPDGQIDDEVFVYGSFLQSRMYAKGVTCSDCHDPHSGDLLAEGNAVCTACHNETPPERFSSIKPLDYDSPAHHFHEAGQSGSACVDCHMPARTYMGVDPRRDHSFRLPRPDLSAKTGAPDACTGCHADRDAAWAAARIAGWYGPDRRSEPHFGEALALGRSGAPGAGERLAALAGDDSQPGIARATAVEMLRRYLDEVTGPVVVASLDDPDPMVRIAALRALEAAPPAERLEMAAPLLSDPVRAVRITAARVLAPVPAASFLGERRAAYLSAVEEFIASELAAAERPEAHLNLGRYWTEQGNAEKAEAAYNTALRLDPAFIPGLVNLSDLERARGRTDAEAGLLERAHALAPEDASVLHALALLRVRQRRHADALPLLEKATRLAPDSARYAHVYAVALESLGQPGEAQAVRKAALTRHPYDIDLLAALLQAQLGSGDMAGASETVDRLLALRPRDAGLMRLRTQLDNR